MIRKANLIFLTVLPILVLTFGIVHMRTALATTYTEECPSIIGTMEVCPEGFRASYVNHGYDSYPACHSVTRTWHGPNGDVTNTFCCQYWAQNVECSNQSSTLPGRWPVEYYRYTNAEVCDSGGGTGMCGGASGTL